MPAVNLDNSDVSGIDNALSMIASDAPTVSSPPGDPTIAASYSVPISGRLSGVAHQ